MAKQDKMMWFKDKKNEKKAKEARISEAMKLLEIQEEKEAKELRKAKILQNYLEKARKYNSELKVIQEELEKVEIKSDSDFKNLYVLLTGINNRIYSLLGDSPEGWPTLGKLPTVVMYATDVEGITHAFSVEILAKQLENHLKFHIEDLEIKNYDFFSEEFELLLLVRIKELLKKLKLICERVF